MTIEERRFVLWDENHKDEIEMIAWKNNGPVGIKGWYRKDDNARTPEYILQPRLQKTKFVEFDIWENEVERPLLAICSAVQSKQDLMKNN